MKEWKIDRICVPTLEDFVRVLNEHEKAGHNIRAILPLKYEYIIGGGCFREEADANMNIGNYQIIYTEEL